MLRESGVSRSELGLWAAIFRADPWGEQRADRRAAIGHALLANIHRDAGKRPSPFKVTDFMAYFEREPEEVQAELASSIADMLGTLGGRRAWDKSEHKARRRDMMRRNAK